MKAVGSLQIPAELDQMRNLEQGDAVACWCVLGVQAFCGPGTRVKNCWIRGERVVIPKDQEPKQGPKGSCPIRLICTGWDPRPPEENLPRSSCLDSSKRQKCSWEPSTCQAQAGRRTWAQVMLIKPRVHLPGPFSANSLAPQIVADPLSASARVFLNTRAV